MTPVDSGTSLVYLYNQVPRRRRRRRLHNCKTSVIL